MIRNLILNLSTWNRETWIYLILWMAPLALGALTIVGVVSNIRLLNSGMTTKARCSRVVTGYRTVGNESRLESDYFVTFKSESNITYEVEIEPGWLGLSEGRELTVIYDPQNPLNVAPADPVRLWPAPLLLGLGAVVLTWGLVRMHGRSGAA